MNEIDCLMHIIEDPLFQRMVGDAQIAATICFQFGDTGKGKIAALLALWADMSGRKQGTSNAGHTSYVTNDKVTNHKVITHYIASSIFYDHLGKETILGGGMGIYLEELLEEMDSLAEAGITFDNMMISEDASLILPFHKMKDAGNKNMKSGSVSSTGKGTGPVYTDRLGRRGIFFRDLFNMDIFAEKLKKAYKEYKEFEVDLDDVVEKHREMFARIKHHVRDTTAHIHRQLALGKKMQIEGAQGTMISSTFGTYGYNTCSDSTIYGAHGCGIKPEDVDIIFGLLKFPVMTRVGNGPFPSEFGGERSEKYCAEGDGYAHTAEKEIDALRGNSPLEMLESDDESIRGIAWRIIMGEYGATTKRPRRTGRFDAVAAKYAIDVNRQFSRSLARARNPGRKIVLVSTKSDCARGIDPIEICIDYEYAEDEPFKTAERTFKKGDRMSRFTPYSELMYRFKGIYEKVPGFDRDASTARTYEELPPELRAMHERVEEILGEKFGIISVGAGTDQIVLVPNH
jgi:adenylosuccinate synthase